MLEIGAEICPKCRALHHKEVHMNTTIPAMGIEITECPECGWGITNHSEKEPFPDTEDENLVADLICVCCDTC